MVVFAGQISFRTVEAGEERQAESNQGDVTAGTRSALLSQVGLQITSWFSRGRKTTDATLLARSFHLIFRLSTDRKRR